MPAKQRMRLANEKHSQNVHTRGNVPKTLVSSEFYNDYVSSETQMASFDFNYWQCDTSCFLKLVLYLSHRKHKTKNTLLVLFYLDCLSSSFVDQVSNFLSLFIHESYVFKITTRMTDKSTLVFYSSGSI